MAECRMAECRKCPCFDCAANRAAWTAASIIVFAVVGCFAIALIGGAR